MYVKDCWEISIYLRHLISLLHSVHNHNVQNSSEGHPDSCEYGRNFPLGQSGQKFYLTILKDLIIYFNRCLFINNMLLALKYHLYFMVSGFSTN